MLATWRRTVPFILAGILLFDIAIAIMNGGRANWIRVAVVALVFALGIWWRRRLEQDPKDPKDPHQR